MHQKQPPAKVALAVRGAGAPGDAAGVVCASARVLPASSATTASSALQFLNVIAVSRGPGRASRVALRRGAHHSREVGGEQQSEGADAGGLRPPEAGGTER